MVSCFSWSFVDRSADGTHGGFKFLQDVRGKLGHVVCKGGFGTYAQAAFALLLLKEKDDSENEEEVQGGLRSRDCADP